jgi:hypothetical protein
MPLRDSLGLPKSRNRLAFVFYATDEDYAVAVLVFVQLLRDLGIRDDADVIVLHLPIGSSIVKKMKQMGIANRVQLPLAPAMAEKMKRMGITSRLFETPPSVKNAFYRHCFLKLKSFQLVEYDRVLFIDADSIPLKNLDYLLSLQISEPVAAPRAYWLQQPFWTSALFIAQPSDASWARVERHFETADERNSYDMDIINCEFSNEIQSLPPATFCLNTEWEDANQRGLFPDPVEAYDSVAVVHFTAVGKPWTYSTDEVRRLRPNAHPIFYDLWDKWRVTREAILK